MIPVLAWSDDPGQAKLDLLVIVEVILRGEHAADCQ